MMQMNFLMKIEQLKSQGYIINNFDEYALKQLNLAELNYVHEFYEVLDA